jgi:hypothetical protein
MITYEQIQKANETIQTTPIKGKNYAEVNQRIKAFRQVYPTGSINTEMLSNENGVCVFKATCGYFENGEWVLLGTGTAYEKESSSFINKTSYIENCETSAVGRALGMCGFGIDTTIASYEEVANAIENQNKADEEKPDKMHIDALIGTAKIKGVTMEKIFKKYKIKDLSEMNYTQYINCVQGLNKMPDVVKEDVTKEAEV